MNAYGTTLLVLHVVGAIAAIGPGFGFAIMGPMAQRGGPGGLAILEAMHAVRKKLFVPGIAIVQPVTGVLLIFNTGLNHNFFHHTWLLAALGFYVLVLVLSLAVSDPAMVRMIAAAQKGEAGTPKFQADAKLVRSLGPVLGISLLAIIVLMVWKPGN